MSLSEESQGSYHHVKKFNKLKIKQMLTRIEVPKKKIEETVKIGSEKKTKKNR